MEMDIDINLKLQNKANEIVNEAIQKTGTPFNKELIDFLKELVMMSMRQGFIWGCSTTIKTNQLLIDKLKEGKKNG